MNMLTAGMPDADYGLASATGKVSIAWEYRDHHSSTEAATWVTLTFRVSPDMQTYRPAVNIVALWSLNSDPACSNEDTLKRKNDEGVLFEGSCDGM